MLKEMFEVQFDAVSLMWWGSVPLSEPLSSVSQELTSGMLIVVSSLCRRFDRELNSFLFKSPARQWSLSFEGLCRSLQMEGL